MDITTSEPRTFSLAGRFDAYEVPAFRSVLDPAMTAPGSVVRLDLANVVFIDSTALAELVRATKHTRATDGDLVVTGVSAPVRVILELTRLDRALTIVG